MCIRDSVNTAPIISNVTIIESTPVCGVEATNAAVEDLLAPLSRNDAAIGITPQEHTGRGIPKITDLKTANLLFSDKCFFIVFFDIKIDVIPAKKNPNSK